MSLNTFEISEPLRCKNCDSSLNPNSKFCAKCGTRIMEVDLSNSRKEIKKFLLAFFIITSYILALYLFKFNNTYQNALIIDCTFFIITGFLSLFFLREINHQVNFDNFNFKKLPQYLGLQIVFTVLVILISKGISIFFNFQDSNMLDAYLESPAPLLTASASIALFPAITEELAFRAILFGQLEKLTSGLSTIITTGILFGLIHFSFISFIWLIPAGLFLGWIRHKEKTIWHGVFCHFIHNLTIVLITFYQIKI